MIQYTTDTNTRTQVYIWLISIAIAIQTIASVAVDQLGKIASLLPAELDIPKYLAAPTAVGLFTILLLVYDNYLWNRRIFGLPMSSIPDFSGVWVGYIVRRIDFKSTQDGQHQKTTEMIAMHLYIKQTFSKISVRTRSISPSEGIRSIESQASVAGLFCQDYTKPSLRYIWAREDLSGEGEFLLKSNGARRHLEGRYSSTRARLGLMTFSEWRIEDNWFCGQVREISSRTGKRYLGIHVPEESVLRYLNEMKSIIGEEAYTEYRRNQTNRDQGSFHITIINAHELERVQPEALSRLEADTWLWVKLIGLGKSIRGTDETLYVVCNCDGARHIRSQTNLGNHDFHITLGFRNEDIYGVPKGLSTLIKIQDVENWNALGPDGTDKNRPDPPDGLFG
jgi:hypothetical protein